MANARILERLRKSRTDLSQRELAKELGMSLSTYQRIVHGEASMTIEMVQTAAQYFKVSEDVILGRSQLVVEEARKGEQKGKLHTPVIVNLDGTQKTLNEWISRLEEINRLI